jgi:hypothetical protein
MALESSDSRDQAREEVSVSEENPEARFRSRLFGASEEKPKPEPQLRRRGSDEPYVEFDWKVSREDSPGGPIVMLEFVNREDESDVTRLGLEPNRAMELGRALTASANA